MEYKAVLKSSNGRSVELLLANELDIDEIAKHAVNGNILAYVDFYEKDGITSLQRKHLYALFGDISEYTGVPLDAVEAYQKYLFMQEADLDDFPSLARGQMRKTVASEFLEFTIVYCINNEIPFEKENWYLTSDTSKMLFAMLMKRLCWICGRQGSDIAHVEVVGIGRNRKKIDHTQHHFMCLCRQHHSEQHQTGIDTFIKKHHIKPIKLSSENIKQLGI